MLIIGIYKRGQIRTSCDHFGTNRYRFYTLGNGQRFGY